jgi:hypothetical protein
VVVLAATALGVIAGDSAAQDLSRADRARLLAPHEAAGPLCYDAVIVGASGDYGKVEALSDLLGGTWFGVRSDLKVQVLSTRRGLTPRDRITVRLIETSLHRPGTRRLFVLRRVDSDHYWAVDWAYVRQVRDEKLLEPATGWLPPQCGRKQQAG